MQYKPKLVTVFLWLWIIKFKVNCCFLFVGSDDISELSINWCQESDRERERERESDGGIYQRWKM